MSIQRLSSTDGVISLMLRVLPSNQSVFEAFPLLNPRFLVLNLRNETSPIDSIVKKMPGRRIKDVR